MPPPLLTDAQLRAALQRCLSCEAKPCRGGCPAGCSPADFILAARCGEPSDLGRAATHVLMHNALGGVCGAVCPEALCMARCARRGLDGAVEIPAIQAAIVGRARALGVLEPPARPPPTGERVAVVGAGPAGIGAASLLARAGHTVHLLDRARRAGGMVRLIPRDRLDPAVLEADLAWLLGLGDVHLVLGKPVALPRELLSRGFGAVVVTAGLSAPVGLDVPGAQHALGWADLLGPRPPALRGRRVAVVGDGRVAVDCAETALALGAAHVELLARRTLAELPLGRRDRERLFTSGVHVTGRVRVTALRGRAARLTRVELRRLELPAGLAFHPDRLVDLPRGEHARLDLDAAVLALGAGPGLRREPHPRVIYAGDLETGPTSVVEALASGKRAALEVHRRLAGDELAACPDRGSCADGSGCPRRATCPEWNRPTAAQGGTSRGRPIAAGLPAPLATELLGLPLASPFLLAAGPYTEGRARMARAYEAGWPGGVATAASLDALCADVAALGREFPDRVTLASLAVRASEDPGADARHAAVCARALATAGAAGVELALPAPADLPGPIDPEGPARVLAAVLAELAPCVPVLLAFPGDTPAAAQLEGVARALAGQAGRRAGLTLSIPAPAPGPRARVTAPSALLDAVARGLEVSIRSAALDYRASVELLAAGARAVQLGPIVARYGLGIIGELHAGLSHFLAGRALGSVAVLGRTLGLGLGARPAGAPGVCRVEEARCLGCGSCTRCAALAVTCDARGLPAIDRARCTGCGLCVELCPSGALALVQA